MCWLQQFSWLSYSGQLDGVFCRYCFLFANKSSSGATGGQVLGKLVADPYRKWKNALKNFRKHEKLDYHVASLSAAANFLEIQKGKTFPITASLNNAAEQELQRGKLILEPIIKTLLLCGRQGLALRRHKDSGNLSLEQPEENDGNFHALLRMRIESGDENLRNHIETSPQNVAYLSPDIQNEIFNLLSLQIQGRIVNEINSAKCSSVIADETTDVAGIQQMSLCARYVTCYENRHIIKKYFLGFSPVESGTGEAIAVKIKS